MHAARAKEPMRRITRPRRTSLQGTLRVIAEEVRHLIGARRCVASILRVDGRRAVRGASLSGKAAGRAGRADPPEAAKVAAMVAGAKHPVRMTRAELQARRLAGDGRSAAPPSSLLAAPLVTGGGKSIGCIWLSDKYEGEFSVQDEETLRHLARVASAVVESARRLQQMESAQGEPVQSLGALVHEIRACLNPIVLWANVLRTGGSDEAARARAIEVIEENARKIADVLTKL